MATTHVVALFLPYTTHFHEKEDERKFSPPQRMTASHPPLASRLSVDLPKRGSTTSLLGDTKAENELFSSMLYDLKQLPITPGNPRSLMRVDVHAPDWGQQAIFNQPRSRAGPLPSGSILDFAKVHQELQQPTTHKSRVSRSGAPLHTITSSYTSRTGSSERDFEAKTWTVETALQGNGGLANAMRESTTDTLPDITWHGTLDFPTDSLPEALKDDISDHLATEFQAQVVYVNDKDFQGHYAGYCKTILWPIFHYQVPDHPKSRAYADHSWKYYKAVNQAFADRVVASYKPEDTIWIHDYHLLLVPSMVRERIPDVKIGFFLHAAFPSSEVFRCLWMRKELLEGMLGADLIAFQNDEYTDHFLQTTTRILSLKADIDGVQLENRLVKVISQPIGINLPAINEQRESAEVQEWIEKISQKYGDKRIIVARDKLDSISGVRHKLLTYELFLNKYPQWREDVVFIQVATSTSDQADLMAAVTDIVTRIEQHHSTLAHQPIVFLRQDIPFSQYLALLSVADVLLVSNLRDGMNLTPHDFIICQDGEFHGKKHGVLILSEFTGSAAFFGKHALLTNPYDFPMQAQALKVALEMDGEEKRSRWEALYNIVIKLSGATWAKSLSASLQQACQEHAAHETISIPRLAYPQVSSAYASSKRRVFVLDYEGTLAPQRTQAGLILGSQQRVIDTLNDLSQDPNNLVYIMSGQTPEALDNHFKTVQKLGMIAENGCFMREEGDNTTWISFQDNMQQWKAAVAPIIDKYRASMPEIYVEGGHCSIIVRFDQCEDKEAACAKVQECADQINGSMEKMRIRASVNDKTVLIETKDHSKAFAAARVLAQLKERRNGAEIDFLFIAGDDREDEGVFYWGNNLQKHQEIKNVFTVSVGKHNTAAQATLTQGTSGLLTTLVKLAKISADSLPTDYFNVKARC